MSVVGRLRRGLRAITGGSDLDAVIAPEIVDDRFAEAIGRIASRPDVSTVVEVGSSSGAGSTRVLFDALRRKDGVALYCLELSEPRFAELRARYEAHPWVHCYHATSVALDAFPTEDEVVDFVRLHGGRALYKRPEQEVVRWLRQDRDYVARHESTITGLQLIKRDAGVEHFDLALIDGSEFTGAAELDALYGARYVLLDDTRTFKNFAARQRLLDDPLYQLLEDDPMCRNGYSVFARHDAG